MREATTKMSTDKYTGKEQLKFSKDGIIIDSMCTWEINADEQTLNIIFNEKNDYFKINNFSSLVGVFSPDHIFLTSLDGEKISLFLCFCKRISPFNTITLNYNYMIVGNHTREIFSDDCKLCKLLRFNIESSPIPINPYIPFGQNQFVINGDIIELIIEDKEYNDVIVEISTLKGNISFNKLTSIFYSIMDFFFVCLGFYPYTTCEQIILADNQGLLLFHKNPRKLEKGNSTSHWSDILVSPEKMHLSKSFLNFYDKFQDNNIVVGVLTNSIHASGMLYDLKLSIVLQCVEGYMTKWHDVNKFDKSIIRNVIDSLCEFIIDDKDQKLNLTYELTCTIVDSVKRLLGNINKQSFAERITAAFELNDFTAMIVDYERTNGLYDKFLTKSKITRNQFAHMDMKKNGFVGDELCIAMEKYILLLRVLILSDLDITIRKSNLEKIIASIDKLYEKNAK